MKNKKSIKFWLPDDLYNAVYAAAKCRKTTMSRVLRTCCRAIFDVLTEELKCDASKVI